MPYSARLEITTRGLSFGFFRTLSRLWLHKLSRRNQSPAEAGLDHIAPPHKYLHLPPPLIMAELTEGSEMRSWPAQLPRSGRPTPSQRGGYQPNYPNAQQLEWRANQNRRPLYVKANATQQQPSGPQHIGPVLKLKEPWQTWTELTVRVYQLPPSVTTWDLFRCFEKEGSIVFIELHENSRGVRQDSARIRFSPPPNTDFWSQEKITIRVESLERSEHVVKVLPEPKKRSFEIQSPIRKMKYYPEMTTLSPRELSFGIMFSETTMMKKRTEVAVTRNLMKLKIDLMRRRIVAVFDVDYEGEKTTNPGLKWIRHMFQVPFGQLRVMHRVKLDNDSWGLLLTLDSPPQFYLKDTNIERTHIKQSLTWSEFDSWFRVTDIVADSGAVRRAVVGLNKAAPMIDIGRWTTYLFVFDENSVSTNEFLEVKSALQDFNIEIVDLESFSTIPNAPAKVWDMIDAPNADQDKNEMHYLMENSDRSTILPFEVRYQLEVCISRNILEVHNITPEFVKELASLVATDMERATCILEYISEQGKRIYDTMSIFKDPDALAHSPKSKIPAYCAYTRKATVTPTTMYFSSPTVETSNRVIRKYSADGDRFLRVQFTDELFEGRINACADKIRNDQLYTRVYRTLKNGIQIGDRHFEFLAFGNSQFRENGAYFFCPTDELSCDHIRNWMGKFHHINVVAKYAARLGLCFSTTRAIRNSGMTILELQDVERNGYTFTDGVGKISPFLMKMIATELHLLHEPSVVQFRMGGCKGILAISPDAKGQEIHIRKSQTKFTAEYMGLEIIRTSNHSVATLNRQTITILSALGVEDHVFSRMLDEQLSNYMEAMNDPDKALELLGRYVDDNHMTMMIAGMVLDGFMRVKESFVLSLLHLWRSWSIKLLKEKAKIIVEKGAFVLGCTDETQTLRGHSKTTKAGKGSITAEDIDQLPQIYLQVTDKKDPRHSVIIEGLCLVGRNPSLHPGDIRVVQAIDVPALHHLRDVVVFSQLGDRDVPGMCSGGDLDGDDFFVIWDQDLLPREWNAEPMDYTAPAPVKLDRAVEINDVMSFFVKYMKSDTLPTIAHAHLALSDQLDYSVRDPKCLELAALHSKAVDFVKSGIPAEMPKYLRPRKWPHFMEKKHKPKEQIYVSEKILGQLYDKVESVDFAPHYESPFDKRILRSYPEDRAILKAARQIKSQYDTAMRRIMAQHDIETEFEVWTSFVLSKPRVGSDYKVQEEMGIISSTLKARFKDICIEAAGGNDFKALGPFVAAMYQVTCEEVAIALHECRTMKTIGGRDVPKRKMEPKSMPLMSFPWIFQSVLGRIATGSEPTTLEDVGLSFVTRNEARTKKPRIAVSDEDDLEDYIETADGVTHRGELLDIFRNDAVDSDGDEVIMPFNFPAVERQVQDEPQAKDEPQVNHDLDKATNVDVVEVDTKHEADTLMVKTEPSEGIVPKAVVKKYRSTLTLGTQTHILKSEPTPDKEVDNKRCQDTVLSPSEPSDVVSPSVSVNKAAVAANSLIDVSDLKADPDQEASFSPSLNDIPSCKPETMSSLGDLEGLEDISEIAASVPLPTATSNYDFSRSTTPIIPVNQGTPHISSPNTALSAVDALANFFGTNYQQDELLSISETSESSRRSSHCEDLAELGGHCHDLADLGGGCSGHDDDNDDGDDTIIQDEAQTDFTDMLSGPLLVAPNIEAAIPECPPNWKRSPNDTEEVQLPQYDYWLPVARSRISAVAEELLVDISSATIQGGGDDAGDGATIKGDDSDGGDYYDGSDYGEEVTLDIEESALEKLQRLAGGA
ncbi:hypothetical protein V495_07655 [Pseudogymnoascus sp. VKM F-4514 (FW-929)]|nr:hypothetical protein V495_07655 [Pseudogymnoascus sp. VKM F-4514 (FW-929)]KFY51451.1 hypothetical protein V497_09135 [Pseudogymnoascus sp. VKM F-4516 (FW-969)]